MKTKDLILMSLRNLNRRKLRTFLTVLGVVIGSISIIMMISLGFGMTDSTKKQLASAGSLTQIDIYPANRYGGMDEEDGKKKKTDKVAKLDDATVEKLKKIPHVEAVLATEQFEAQINVKNLQGYASIIGVDPVEYAKFDIKLDSGRMLQEGDVNQVVMGRDVLRWLSNPQRPRMGASQQEERDPLTTKMFLTLNQAGGFDPEGNQNQANKPKQKYQIEAVGVFRDDDYENNYYIVMPIDYLRKMKKDAKKLQAGNRQNGYNDYMYGGREDKENKYNNIKVKVDNVDNVQKVQEQIEAMGLKPHSLNDILVEINNSSKTQRLILGGIGAVSLLVAAIGISNTMVMSIYERTKEIGVMKVIGASVSDIKKMFLTESAFIGLLGGLIGIVLSYAISALLNYLGVKYGFAANMSGGGFSPDFDPSQLKMSIIPAWLALASLVFSALIGIVSGYFPAKKATKLSALEAMRQN
ncbi:ABC transporter permease [uncultured Fenollaria sp.]|uniref:ABC transporter permease n=1 Tax=uncultured Fenollaria sp. TaxID=1686315 RepID=UPI002600C11A|nr:FtsX-like permease family protein [uncultured Fenollaria sp.]